MSTGRMTGADAAGGGVLKGEDEVVELLVAAGADPAAGQPSAIDAARVFGRAGYLELFGVAGPPRE